MATTAAPDEHSANPVCMGGAILGLAFDGGVVIAGDNGISYGNTRRYRGLPRVMKVDKTTILGVSGDYADFQYLQNVIENKAMELRVSGNEDVLSPEAWATWMQAVLYKRRSDFDPLWNQYVIGGVKKGQKEPFLAYVNQIGLSYTGKFVMSGMSNYFVKHMIELEYDKKGDVLPSREEVVALMEKALEIMFYSDCKSWREYDMAIVTEKGTEITSGQKVEENWALAEGVVGYEDLGP